MTILELTQEQEAFAEDLAEKHGAVGVTAGRSSYVVIEGGAWTQGDVWAAAERFRVTEDGTPLPACSKDAECRACPGIRGDHPGGFCSYCYEENLDA